MIDIKLLRENTEKLKKAVADKGFDSSLVDKAFELDEKRRGLMQEVQKLQAERNLISSKNQGVSSKGKEMTGGHKQQQG